MKEPFDEIESLIRKGASQQARKLLRSVLDKKIGRQEIHRFAALARRAGLPYLSVRLLHPIVRPTGSKLWVATDEERSEYAASLTYLGAAEEALALLRVVDSTRVPDALLFEAFALFAQWNYEQSIPILERYVSCKDLNDYARTVGKVNLLAAFIAGSHYQQADTLARELLAYTHSRQLNLLYGNCLELSAQSLIQQSRWAEARTCLEKAAKLFEDTLSLGQLFVRKWTAVMNFEKARNKASALAELASVRQQAQDQSNWETVRDCDRVRALGLKDRSLLAHLYFGTPFECYRKRLLDSIHWDFQLPDHYVWKINGSSGNALDLLLGHPGAGGLKAGQVMHKLLLALVSDFYRPLRVAVAYRYLYPDEFYNPVTSPARIHEAVRRLKGWFRAHKLPLMVSEKLGYYSLQALRPCSIKIYRQGFLDTKSKLLASRAKHTLSSGPFSAKEAAIQLGLSTRSTLRLLQQLQSDGTIERIGNGPRTQYRFVK
ncbi:MAG: hypothetical protein HY537_06620 [Deltaproteobacteria bacterium]|nr:hypothetical protein [Deltaproteobacteria bacterium]